MDICLYWIEIHIHNRVAGIILCMRTTNERRRYVTSSLIGWTHTLNDPWGQTFSAMGVTQAPSVNFLVKGPWLTHWRYCTHVLILDICLSMNGCVDKRCLCGRCWRAYRINFMAILWSIYSGLRQSFWGKMADIIKLSTRDLHTMS